VGGNIIVTSVAALGLGALGGYGGPLQTVALLPGSPAIDAGDNALAVDATGQPLATDERGAPRVVNGTVDIGAYEVVHAIVVTTLADEDNGSILPSLGTGTSLREAIAFADQNPGHHSITFAVSGTISLGGTPLPAITGDLTVTAPPTGLTIDAHGASGIFQVNAGTTVSLGGLTLANGSAPDGGAILNAGTLTLTNDTLTGCFASQDGGGIENVGVLTLTNDTLSGNSADSDGGAIHNLGTVTLGDSTLSGNSASGSGGGIDNLGTLTLSNDTLSGNNARMGGGIFNAAAVAATASTLSGNSASGDGGGIANLGALALVNSTLAGNAAGTSGGGVYNAGTLTLTNATLTANSASVGGGVYSHYLSPTRPGLTTLANSIVGGNTLSGGTTPSDLAGDANVAAASSHNLIGPGGAGGLQDGVGGNIVVASAAALGLGPLGFYFGPTATVPLLPGSPAIDTGDNALAADATGQPLATDQRGLARVVNGTVDIGAYEVIHTIVVTTLADEDNGSIDPSLGSGTSLREAINFADANFGADTITFAVAGTITLTGPLPALTDAATTTITGPAGGITLDAHGASGILQVNAGASVSLSGLTLANGSAPDGGAILNAGTLTLTNDTLTDNSASGSGGGIDNVGALTLSNCTLTGNSASVSGGGIANSGALTVSNCTLTGNSASGSGGGIANSATLALSNCTVSHDSASGFGGGIDNLGTLTVNNSTLAGNAAGQDGGGIHNLGTLALTNSTLAGNAAGRVGGGIASNGTLTVNNCTLSGNSAIVGGGIINVATLLLNNSIVANSPQGGDLAGPYTGSHNLFGAVALSPLGNYGGLTQTMALLPGSPAIGQGDASLQVFSDPGFEAPALGAGAYEYTPTGSPWTFAGQAGLASNGSIFNNPAAPQGSQVAFLQNSGSISQAVDFAADMYVLSFMTAQRPGNAQTFQVKVDGVVVATVTPSGSQFASYTTGPFTVTAGSHTIQLVGLNPQGGDNTAFLDQIQIHSVQLLTTDQRGYPRGSSIDIGAFQDQGFTLTPVTGSTPQSTVVATAFGNLLAVIVTANNTPQFTNPVDGGQVTFTAPASSATAGLSAATATIAGGQASVTATASTVVGSYTVTATAETASAGFALTNNRGTPAIVSVVSGSGQSAVIGTAFTSPLVVLVTDAYGNVEPGVTVTFAAPASGATAALSNSTAVTDSNGRASITVTAGTTIGHYTVTASAAGTSSAGFNLLNAEAPSLVVNMVQDVVDNADDKTSLREAIAYADSLSGPATITFDPTVFPTAPGSTPQTITLTGGQLELSKTSGTETILGPGAGLLKISGNDASRVFQVDAGVTAVLEDLEVTGGRAPQDGAGNAAGGGIFTSGNLELDNVLLDHNTAAGRAGSFMFPSGNGFDGGAGQGGGLYVAAGIVTLNKSTLSNNSAQGGRGGDGDIVFGPVGAFGGSGGVGQGGSVFIAGGNVTLNDSTLATSLAQGGNGGNAGTIDYFGNRFTSTGGNGGNGQGGVIYIATGSLTLNSSSIATSSAQAGNGGNGDIHNQASAGGDGWGGGLYDGSATVLLNSSTLSGNSAQGGSAGSGRFGSNGSGMGGGLFNDFGGRVDLINSTVSGNSAQVGGGLYNYYLSSLTNCTVSDNSAQVGGGIGNQGLATLANTIVAGQTSGGDIGGVFLGAVTGDNNLIGDGSGGISGTGNLLGTPANPINPLLSPLGNYGGPTQTMALLPGSPAIDAGNSSLAVDVHSNAPSVFSDPGFEAPALGAGAYEYTPTGSPWTFAGGAGLASNGSVFNNPPAPQGSQVAFLQNSGSISQAVDLAAGTYTLSFMAAQRPGNQQTFEVLVDGAVVATVTPSGSAFAPYSTDAFTVKAGSHTIQFVGLNPLGGDNTAFLDQIPNPLTTDQRGPGFARVSGANVDIGAYEVQVQQQPPTVTSDQAAVTGHEGSPATNTGTYADAAGNGAVTLTASVGTVTKDDATGTWSWSYTPAEESGSPTTVTITATDGSSLQATTTFTLTVNDAHMSDTSAQATASATEGATTGTLTLATFTDANPGNNSGDFTATIHWGDGNSTSGTVSYSNGTYSVSGSHTYAEEGSYAVTVDVSDDGGSSLTGIGRTTVTVGDAALSDRTGTTALSAKEGASTGDQVVGTFSDADPNAVPGDYTATIYWGDGSSSPASAITQSGGTFSVHGSHPYAEEGTFHPYAVVTDNEGNPALTTGRNAVTTSQTLVTETVALVAPTAGVSGPGNGVPGQPRTFTFTASDPDPTDQAAGFVYTINWGDGTATQTIARTAGNGSGVEVDHIYTAPGTYTVKVTATEDGGDTSAAAAASLTVQTVQMQGGTLAVGGTLGNDTIVLSPADTTGDINVNYNGTSLGNFKPTDHILVYGQSGNDTIRLASKKFITGPVDKASKGTVYYITVPAFLYGGGTGKDVLDASGSTANNVLQGGGGSNQLIGGLGRDLLIAGLGASQLVAGSGDDLLVGGWTGYDLTSSAMTYDRKLAALEAIMAEWGSSDGYTTRVNDLQGGGLNGLALLNTSTVHENGLADTLIGTTGSALDWFLAGLTDVIKNKKTGEVQTSIS
jgi:CSLREA domain-containing protein